MAGCFEIQHFCTCIKYFLLVWLFLCIIVAVEEKKEDYIKCELIVEGLQDIKTLSCLLLLYTTHIDHMLCIVAIVDYTMHTKLSTTKYQNVPYLVAIVDCTHVGSATAYFKDLVTMHRRTL